MSIENPSAPGMVEVCAVADLAPERGCAALVAGRQVALFLLEDGTVHAVQQRDPYSGANVLSRGLVGSHALPAPPGEEPRVVSTLSSPMYKQVWDLGTGAVLDAGGGQLLPIAVHDAEVRAGRVLVSVQPRPLVEAEEPEEDA
ncbi:nitrite reductase (NAD(P)H) small subunit [Brachybacterium hainanense]|uniref:Nitrite reductase (NAD(P)H) small subunit n=1 Tax=Brachybacterium hainanense TaxID=1541174 RepID=A0ABV6R8S6_9MICO